MHETAHFRRSDIAIVGMSCRFPGASNAREFWENLRNGVDSISFFTDEELTASGVNLEITKDNNYIPAGGVLEDIAGFDAPFFNFSHREAELQDPQRRILLECAYEALEDSGYTAEYIKEVGVFVGVGMPSYMFNFLNDDDFLDFIDRDQIFISNDKDFSAPLISYKLNLTGPSITVQTACSTSLVAVHLACKALLSGECKMALAGGASIIIPQKSGYIYRDGGTKSSDGRCRAFDASAQGFVPGSGAGVVALRRLEDALADGAFIYAVIKASSVNNDGARKVGYTAPSIVGQAQVIRQALTEAGIAPNTIGYVEAHGSATFLGDPIEIAALSEAFSSCAKENGGCAIGSVKSNIGHLDIAAGVAGLIKAALALTHKKIPPSLHFVQPNPNIDFANSPFFVNTRLREWDGGGAPRRAGVTSLGIGGTNAHVILEEAPALAVLRSSSSHHLLLFSAKTSTALDVMCKQYAQYFRSNPDANLADVAHTLRIGRVPFSHRIALVCADAADAAAALESRDPRRVLTGHCSGNRAVAFIFPDEGVESPNIGRGIYESDAEFKQTFDLCAQILQPMVGFNIRDVLFPQPERVEDARQRLKETLLTHTTLFCLEYSLSQWWIRSGVRPACMVGYSLGEYVAACIAGVFSLQDALRLIVIRARLIDELPHGSMLAVSLSRESLDRFLNGDLSVAAINSTSHCTISGTIEAIGQLENRLRDEGIVCTRLSETHAFHSSMMDEILIKFAEEVRKIELNPPQTPYISNVSGTWITAAEAVDPEYWAKHLRQPVQFMSGLQEILDDQDSILLEVGPKQSLTTLTRQQLGGRDGREIISSLSYRQTVESEASFPINALARVWIEGINFDTSTGNNAEGARRLPLPTYPFERQRYWIAVRPPANQASPPKGDVSDWYYMPVWKRGPHIHSKEQPREKYLVFADRLGLGAMITERLRAAGQQVVQLVTGPGFSRIDEQIYSINPGEAFQYDALLNELRSQEMLPAKIINCWSLTPDLLAAKTPSISEEAQNRGFYSLIYLAQAIGRVAAMNDFLIVTVTNHIQDVTGEEMIDPGKALLLGPSRVIPQEYSNIRCRNIDIVYNEVNNTQSEQLLHALTAEFGLSETDPFIAYRGSYRWTQNFESMPLQNAVRPPTQLYDGRVYLITGGLGEIGFSIASYLARSVRSKLALVGRSVLPARNEWTEWLESHDRSDSVSVKIRRILELEQLGAEVLVVSADVADAKAIRAAIARIENELGAIKGVIHAAGIVGREMFFSVQEMDRSALGAHFRPKVLGLLELEAALSNKPPDFYLLLSSISSVLGGPGLAPYAAANIFMDVFAALRNRASPAHWISLNLDAWAPSASDSVGEIEASHGIPSGQGVDVFEQVLGIMPRHPVIVSTTDLRARLERWINLPASRSSNLRANESAGALHRDPEVANRSATTSTPLQMIIAEIWRQQLGADDVGIHDNFFDLGGHSLIAVHIAHLLRNKLKVEVSLDDILDAPTVAELSVIIEKAQQQQDGRG